MINQVLSLTILDQGIVTTMTVTSIEEIQQCVRFFILNILSRRGGFFIAKLFTRLCAILVYKAT